MESVYSAVRTDSLYKADYVSSLKGLGCENSTGVEFDLGRPHALTYHADSQADALMAVVGVAAVIIATTTTSNNGVVLTAAPSPCAC